MNIQETAVFAAKIQSFDNRNFDAANIAAWQELMAPYTMQDCVKAVSEYFSKSAAWIMPVHVIELVRDIESARRNAFHNGVYPTPADEVTGNWGEVSRRLNRAVATGKLTPEAYDRYQDQNLTLDSVLGLVAIQ